jgi:hypothetical protein
MTRHPLYRSFFGFVREPFSIELNAEEIFTTPGLQHFTERFDYVLRLGAIGLLSGEVGAGKSTASLCLKPAPSLAVPPPLDHRLGRSILETYRQLAGALDIETKSFSRAALTRIIRHSIYELVNKKIQPLLIIDEASPESSHRHYQPVPDQKLAYHHRRTDGRRRYLGPPTAPRLQNRTERRINQKNQEMINGLATTTTLRL